MKIQVLVAAMNQKDKTLPQKMNIQSDAVIGNQCGLNSVEEITYNGHAVKYLNTDGKGVGLNRNNSLMGAEGDVVVFADDDEKFFNNYTDIISNAYKELPDADAIIFNIESIGGGQDRRVIKKISKVNLLNSLNYGAVRLTVKNDSIKRANIVFNRLFGGGTRYSSGEDTLFIVDMLKKGLKIYTYPAYIASVEQTTSTWFCGYTEKYFYDKGALFAALDVKFSWVLCLALLFKNRKQFKNESISFRKVIKLARNGYKGYRHLISYKEYNEKKMK